MENASSESGNGWNYGVVYDQANQEFEITHSGDTLNLKFSNEEEPPSNTIAETLGFNPSSHTGLASYTSDYPPVLMKFDSTNNRIDFREVRADGEYSDEISVAVPEGDYTDLDDVASQIEAEMRNASPNNVNYAVSYDYTAGEFMIKGSDKNIKSFSMLWQTGSSRENSAGRMLGFSADNEVTFAASDEPVVNITLDSSNNKIDFREITTDNEGNLDVCELTALVEENTYESHEELALEVEKALEKASVEEGNRVNYAVSWDEVTQNFTIKEKGDRLDEFRLDWKSGENAPLSVGGNGESIGGVLGFDPEDDVAKAAESDRKAEWGIFNTLIDLKSYLKDNDTYGIERTLGRLDGHYQKMTQRVVDSGMKYSRLETRETITGDVSLSLTERRSSIEDADMIESIMNLKNIQTAYQAALNSTSQILNLSLVDYLR
ncbi:MAG: flagellin [Desulfobacteraceae bacterium]